MYGKFSTRCLIGAALGLTILFAASPASATTGLSLTMAWRTTAAPPTADEGSGPAPYLDLIQDRPSYLEVALDYSGRALQWTWDVLYDNVLHYVAPPTPASMAENITKDDAMDLAKLLNFAGYKLKKVENEVGLIPTISLIFGHVKDLSEADYEYLATQLEDATIRHPGIMSSLQRSIVETIVTINTSGDHHVSDLEVQILPLPEVAFTVSPNVGGMSLEASALMGALVKVDKGVVGMKRDMGSKK